MSVRSTAVILASVFALAHAGIGCDSSSSAVKETPPNSGGSSGAPGSSGSVAIDDGGAGADGGAADAGDCFINPQTHEQIINACTDAVKIAKDPVLPLRYSDGGLPPLP